MPVHIPIVGLTLISLLVLVGCNGGSSGTEADVQRSARPPVSVDPVALREKYGQYLQAMGDDRLPSTRIQETGKVYPVDEALVDTAFFVFREQLKETLAAKDAFGLMQVVAADIRYDFGRTDGTAGFVRQWGLDHPTESAHSPIWEVLTGVLKGGGIFTDGGRNFVAPYSFACFPETEDAMTAGIVVGTGVRVRESPSTKGTAVYKLSHDIVEIISITPDTSLVDGEAYPWVHIRHKGKEGYIFGKYLQSPLGFRAFFSKNATGAWELSLLLSGD